MNGASVSWNAALPVNSLVLGISFVILEDLQGVDGLLIGDQESGSKFYNSTYKLKGQGLSISNSTAFPYVTNGTKNIIVTARGEGGVASKFTAGKVKIVVNYLNIAVPTLS